MSGFSDSRGHTLIELLVTMSLLAVVMGATTTFWVSFNKTERINQNQNEAQGQVRNGTEQISRQLRNLASPNDNAPEAIDFADDNDLVFRTVDPTGTSATSRHIKRVRYCLSDSSNGSENLVAQEQKDPPANYPSTSTCPNGAWGGYTTVAQDIVNREQSQPVFTYTPNKTDTRGIYAIQMNLAVDVTPGTKSPAPTKLASGVFLRNQNRAPVASCTAVAGTGRQIVLNGSGSRDPEGRSIQTYTWLDSGGQPLTNGTEAVKGAFALWSAPAAGTYVIRVRVTDYGGLNGEANCNQPVVVP